MTISSGRRADAEHVVSDADTATALGSGDVPVLATPRLIAWAEAATVAAVDGLLDPGETSVGTSVHLEHVAASAVGSAVRISAVLDAIEGRALHFTVTATARDGRLLATGTVNRVVVSRERFLGRL